jgi:hypothetical protein
MVGGTASRRIRPRRRARLRAMRAASDPIERSIDGLLRGSRDATALGMLGEHRLDL